MSVTSLVSPEVSQRPPVPAVEAQPIIEAVRLLHPGRPVELRALNVDGRGLTASGYFDQPRLLAEAAMRYTRRAEGVYVTLNPIPTSLLARVQNRMQERPKATTSDPDILRRAYFPIDLDPRRPSGISSSGAEHRAALDQAQAVRLWLLEQFRWHAPIIADSGNGAHLLYAIDLPNDAESADLIKRCLAALAARFDTPAVGLDTSVYNAARIWKLYGTLARKGESLPERPHRLARIISTPDPLELVSREQLEALAALASTVAGASGGGTRAGMLSVAPPTLAANGGAGSVSEADLLAWLEARGAVVWHIKREVGRALYLLEACPFEAHHQRKSFVSLGDDGALGFRCFAESCEIYHWRDLKALWQGGPLSDAPRLASTEAGATSRTLPLVAPPSLAANRFASTEAGATSEDDAASVPVASPSLAASGARPWPEPPDESVYYGLAGEIVRAIQPHTEADPIALLAHLLTAFGCAVGRGPHLLVGATRHEPRLFSVVVGKSANARKGDAWAAIRAVLLETDAPPRIQTSLSSGEGLIRLVADEVSELRPVKGAKGQSGYEKVVLMSGVEDKRLLVVAGEMAILFQVMRRDGNTLSAILRDGWDHGDLSVATRNDPLRATGAYVAIVGHITADELRRELTGLHAANGFANRFCWLCVRRSQVLPLPEALGAERLAPLARQFGQAVQRARQIERMDFDPRARKGWTEIYADLSRERDGFAGALLSRAPAQAVRLSPVYALLDGSPVITLDHLTAAMALWEYAERSVVYLFGDQSGDPLTEKIEAALAAQGELTRSQIRELVGPRVRVEEIAHVLEALEQQGKIVRELQQGQTGRPREILRAHQADA